MCMRDTYIVSVCTQSMDVRSSSLPPSLLRYPDIPNIVRITCIDITIFACVCFSFSKNAFGENWRVYCVQSTYMNVLRSPNILTNELITIIYRCYCDFRYNRSLLLWCIIHSFGGMQNQAKITKKQNRLSIRMQTLWKSVKREIWKCTLLLFVRIVSAFLNGCCWSHQQINFPWKSIMEIHGENHVQHILRSCSNSIQFNLISGRK